MSIATHTLLWLFPIAFMFHDFEEIIFWELWLNKNGGEIKSRVPDFLAKPVGAIVEKSTAQAALSICLIFSLTVLSAWMAVEYQNYRLFLLASTLFFAHGFIHLGQALILRRYVPAIITSALIIIPYGLVLYGRLIAEGIIDLPGLFIHALLGVILFVPLVLVMHRAGDYLFHKAVKLLID